MGTSCKKGSFDVTSGLRVAQRPRVVVATPFLQIFPTQPDKAPSYEGAPALSRRWTEPSSNPF